MRRAPALLAWLAFVACLAACSDPQTPQPDPGELVSLSVLPLSPTVPLYGTLQLAVQGHTRSGDVYPGPLQPLWTSSVPTIASINEQGEVSGRAVGVTQIEARVGKVYASVDLQVLPTTIRVYPGEVKLRVGATQPLTATVLTSNALIPDAIPQWSSDDPSIASVHPGENGALLEGHRPGKTTIRVTFEDLVTEVTVEIGFFPVGLKIKAPALLLVGEETNLEAQVTDEAGNPIQGAPIHWSVTPTSVASIAEDGRLFARQPGLATVGATADSVHAEVKLQIEARAPAAIEVDFPTEILEGERHLLTAQVRDQRGAPLDWEVTWVSSRPNIATVSLAGVIEGHAPGWTWLTARAGQVEFGGQVLVLPSPAAIVIHTTTDVLYPGDRHPLRASVVDRRGRPVSDWPIAWSSSHPERVAVGQDGWLEPLQAGKATLLAEGAGLQAELAVEVKALRFITVEPGGGSFHCALSVEGEVYCWGVIPPQVLTVEQTTKIESPLPFASLSVGKNHACALTAAGEAYCFGLGGYGQLGSGSFQSSDRFLPVSTSLRFLRIHAGNDMTCGITEAAEGPNAACWGENKVGQLGNGTQQNANIPQLIPGHRFSQLALGLGSLRGLDTCGLDEAGAASCWGTNAAPAQSDSAHLPALSPLPTAPSFSWAHLAIASGPGVGSLAGGIHRCGITMVGETYCWGSNGSGELGRGDFIDSDDPVLVEGNFEALSLIQDWRRGRTCGLAPSGAASCWGAKTRGSFGEGDEEFTLHPSPIPALSGHTFSTIRLGPDRGCGMTLDGVAMCWGALSQGEPPLPPTPVPGQVLPPP